MFWCAIYPMWLRVAGLVPAALFTLVYVNVHQGFRYRDLPLNAGYATLQVLEIIWAVYLWRDWKKTTHART